MCNPVFRVVCEECPALATCNELQCLLWSPTTPINTLCRFLTAVAVEEAALLLQMAADGEVSEVAAFVRCKLEGGG